MPRKTQSVSSVFNEAGTLPAGIHALLQKLLKKGQSSFMGLFSELPEGAYEREHIVHAIVRQMADTGKNYANGKKPAPLSSFNDLAHDRYILRSPKKDKWTLSDEMLIRLLGYAYLGVPKTAHFLLSLNETAPDKSGPFAAVFEDTNILPAGVRSFFDLALRDGKILPALLSGESLASEKISILHFILMDRMIAEGKTYADAQDSNGPDITGKAFKALVKEGYILQSPAKDKWTLTDDLIGTLIEESDHLTKNKSHFLLAAPAP